MDQLPPEIIEIIIAACSDLALATLSSANHYFAAQTFQKRIERRDSSTYTVHGGFWQAARQYNVVCIRDPLLAPSTCKKMLSSPSISLFQDPVFGGQHRFMIGGQFIYDIMCRIEAQIEPRLRLDSIRLPEDYLTIVPDPDCGWINIYWTYQPLFTVL